MVIRGRGGGVCGGSTQAKVDQTIETRMKIKATGD